MVPDSTFSPSACNTASAPSRVLTDGNSPVHKRLDLSARRADLGDRWRDMESRYGEALSTHTVHAFVAGSVSHLCDRAASKVIREQITLRGTVEGIDHTARTVTIRGDRGNVVTLDVPNSAAPFDQFQVGDVVTVAYYDRVSVRLKPAGEAAVDRTDPPVATTTPGTLPGATIASQRVTTVTITGWDPALRVVTFTGPTGTTYTRRLLDTTDASVMAGLKVGDRVDVTRTEAVRLAVESAHSTVQVTATSDFANRFTLSALWGWDNQFSGNMIHGGHRADDDRRADQHERHELRRRVRPHGDASRLAPATASPPAPKWCSTSSTRTARRRGERGHRGRGQRAAERGLRRLLVLGDRRRPAVLLHPHPFHALCGLPGRPQPLRRHQRHLRRCPTWR